MILKDDLIGCNHPSEKIYFTGSDTRELFLQNLKIMPADWYYNSADISYVYNKHGHRCKEINDLNFDDYILFCGDSHTEGLGLELEKTYPFLTAKSLNSDYYNLGLGGTGLDYMVHNLIVWLTKFPKPKYICLYFSDYTRFLRYEDGRIDTFVESGSWNVEHDVKKMLVSGENCGFFQTRFNLFCLQLKNLLNFYNVPHAYISIFYSHITNLNLKVFERNQKCVARDLQHVGIDTHKTISDYLVSYYNDKYLDARDNHDIRGQK
jgi:hypothetical protein